MNTHRMNSILRAAALLLLTGVATTARVHAQDAQGPQAAQVQVQVEVQTPSSPIQPQPADALPPVPPAPDAAATPQAPPAQYGQGATPPPTYGQPAPVYGQPAYGRPVYQQQPVYGQPTYQPLAPQPRVRERPPALPNMVMINPALLLVGQLSLGYERALVPHVSLSVDATAIVWDGVYRFLYNTDTHFAGGGVSIAPRFFFRGEAPRGVWLAPVLDVSYVRAWLGDLHADGIGVSGLVTAGYTWQFGHFAFSAGGGAGVRYIKTITATSDDSSTLVDKSVSLAIYARLALGYAF